MSDVLYPIGLVNELETERLNRVLRDEFEAGNTTARRLWGDREFKRRFLIRHAPLTRNEARWLSGFHAQRNGGHDSFWFRDNVFRRGNSKVRFAGALRERKVRAQYLVEVELEEVAPVKPLPEWGEVVSACGTAPLFWWDANRQSWIEHAGAIERDAAVWDESGNYHAPFQTGELTLPTIYGQWQHYKIAPCWAVTSGNVAELAAGTPAFTLFCFARVSTNSVKGVLASVGATGAGNAMGLVINGSNSFEPWIGGTEDWTGARISNSTADTWRSLAVGWAGGSNTAEIWANGMSGGTKSNTRNYTAGPASLGASPSGTVGANVPGGLVNCDVAHVIAVPALLTTAQVKALHNLFCYQFGLASVA